MKMPKSYRDGDERAEDRLVYFDYARSLEQRRRPMPWRALAGAGATFAVVTFAAALRRGSSLALAALFASIAFVCAAALIPAMLARRSLSGTNLVAIRKRGEAPIPTAPPDDDRL
ncbi:MAG: hypothetical protein KF819_35215 [Labilithrix sp.]|nr:hypothetical protein [Labilithrix sp.]